MTRLGPAYYGMEPCEFCGRLVDPNARGTYTHVEGWDVPRAAGGTNHLVLRERSHRYACAACIDYRRRVTYPGQGSMLP